MKRHLELAVRATILAGKEVMYQYQNGFQVFTKPDSSPVTSADLAAHDILESNLLRSGISVLSEEGEKWSHDFRQNNTYWCLDPIDGTKDYVNKTDEFCVCVGLIHEGTSVLGVLYAPALDLFYFAAKGIGSYKFHGKRQDLESLINEINLLDELVSRSVFLQTLLKPENQIFLTSRFHRDLKTNEYIQELKSKNPDLEILTMGCAIKLGIISERKATEYTRFMGVNFWDVASGHAIAKYAGLKVCYPETDEEINYKDSNMRIEGYSVKL